MPKRRDHGGPSGPHLPVALTKELFGEKDSGQYAYSPFGRHRAASRKERRKAERRARKVGSGRNVSRVGAARDESRAFGTSKKKNELQRLGTQGSTRHRQPVDKEDGNARLGVGGVKRPRETRMSDNSERSESKKSSKKHALMKSRFDELLPASNDGELVLQRALAKKLGLKRGKTKLGGDDGIDEMLQGELKRHLVLFCDVVLFVPFLFPSCRYIHQLSAFLLWLAPAESSCCCGGQPKH